MIGAPNTRGQKYWVGIVQWASETSVLDEIADTFRNYNKDEFRYKISPKFVPMGTINNILALVQIKSGRRIGDKPLSEPMLTWFTDADMRP